MKSVFVLAAALALAACASQSTTTNSTASNAPEKEYRTGSRIPVRDGVSSSPTETSSPSAMNPALPPKI